MKSGWGGGTGIILDPIKCGFLLLCSIDFDTKSQEKEVWSQKVNPVLNAPVVLQGVF